MASIRPSITIGVQPNTKLLRIERVLGALTPHHDMANRAAAYMVGREAFDWRGGAWMIWINSNIDFTAGTYVLLHDDGTVQRVTVHLDGSEDVFDIKKERDHDTHD